MILRKLVNRSLKMDLDYDYLTVTASSEVRGFDNYMKVVRSWLENHEPSQDFWVKTPISDISNRKLSELRGLVPALGELNGTFKPSSGYMGSWSKPMTAGSRTRWVK